MQVFSLPEEAEYDPKKHVEKILGRIEEGDVTVACWEPGQISPYHCHPDATEIYFCFEGGGVMRTPLFRVRYGTEMRARHWQWRGRAGWTQSADDAEYCRAHPVDA